MRRCLLALAACAGARGWSMAAPPPPVTDIPTIGILSIPLEGAPECETRAPSRAADGGPNGLRASGGLGFAVQPSCFNSFYVHWLEGQGARASVIPFDAPPALLDELVDSVNGILLTGGGLEADVLNLTSPYMAAAGRIFRRVQARNKSGSFLPMHGTCQGMQVLAILGAQDPSVLHERAFDSENMSLPLHLNASEVVDSRLLGPGTPAHVLDTLTRQNCTMNLHRDGIPPSAWWASPLLPPFFRLLSTNVDREGLPFVSTIEARDYPITATQWHPERPQFEFKPNVGVAHTRDAIEAMQYVAGFFVEDARRNTQSFANATLDTLLSMYAFPSVVDDTMPLLWGYSSFYFSL